MIITLKLTTHIQTLKITYKTGRSLKKVTLHVKLVAQAEHTAAITDDLPALIESIQTAEGCIAAKLYRSVDEPNTFFFIQTWINESYWAAHNSSDFVKAFSKKYQGHFKESIITHLDEIL